MLGNKTPGKFCEVCNKRDRCIKICTPLENYLQRKPEGRKYSDRWIRKKEIQFDPNVLETTMYQEEIKNISGKRKRKKVDLNPW